MPVGRCSIQSPGLWFCSLTLLISGCSQTGPSPTAPAQHLIATPADRSLETDAYIKLGMPAPDRTWTGSDLEKVAKVLTALVEKDPNQLPRSGSKRSGNFFDRITSTESLKLFQDRSLPVQPRFAEVGSYYQALNQILKLYVGAFAKRAVGDTEVIAILGSAIQATSVTLMLANEFLLTLDKDDPDYAVRLQGLERMRRGLGDIVAGSLMSLTEKNTYRLEERDKLLEVMKKTLPALSSKLLPDSRTELLIRLEQMSADPALEDLRPGLKDLLARVRSEAVKKEAPAPGR